MAEALFPFGYLRDARLAAQATSATPAVLWQADGRRILWANGAAAALAGASSAVDLTTRAFGADDTIAAQIAGLADSLPANGSPRIATLPSFDGQADHTLTGLCARLTVGDTEAILVVGTAAVSPAVPLADRLRLMLGDSDAPVAAFAPDGNLLHATRTAADLLPAGATLATLQTTALAAQAIAQGHAEGPTPHGVMRIDRIGRDAATALLVTLPATAEVLHASESESVAPESTPPAITTSEIIAPVTADHDVAAAAPETEVIAPPISVSEFQQPDETDPTDAEPAALASEADEQPPERRHPYRFVWVMDQGGHFSITSPDFIELIGPESSAMLGHPWIDIAAKLGLDPDEQVSRAIDSRETWSGLKVHWPVDGTPQRLTVELSGLPMFDRDRTFRGYRGFGVYRDLERLLAPSQTEIADVAPEPVAEAEPVPAPLATVAPEAAQQAEAKAPALSPVERTAFRELARQLSARLKGGATDAPIDPIAEPLSPEADDESEQEPEQAGLGFAAAAGGAAGDGARAILDRLPIGVLVYRINTPLYANRAFLTWSGDASLEAFASGGGLDRLFLESGIVGNGDDAKSLSLTADGTRGPTESRLFSTLWDGDRAHVLAITPAASEQREEKPALRQARARNRELRAALNLAADGVVMLDAQGHIVRLNRQAEGLFGPDAKPLIGRPFIELLAPESHAVAAADFQMLVTDPGARHAGREVMGRGHAGDRATLFMTIGGIEDEPDPLYCLVFRDISQWKHIEQDLIDAKRHAEQASKAKSDFIAKLSHEIRTPLNAIIGFSDVMMEERLGPIENERYRAYLKDINASGEHLVALLNDLLDLSKIEAGKLDLHFGNVNLNDLTQECVGLMQPQANRGRVIIRTSLAPGLPPIVADARSVRQILLNLMSNSIKFTGVGGQVIVSTTLTERGEAVLRVRDTGIGMSENEIETALEPFRQIETSARGGAGGSGGTGLGLPLTKALAEANRANFAIKSSVDSGTLVEVAFPTSPTPPQ